MVATHHPRMPVLLEQLQATKAYVAHHLHLAGSARPVFTEDALRLLFQHTQGIPRRVNSLAVQSLEAAYLRQHELVDLSTMELVTADAS